MLERLAARFRPCEDRIKIGGSDFACGNCDPCRERRKHDAIGRCLAEALCSEAAFAVTLTIGSDRFYGSTVLNPKAQALFKPDIAAFNMRLSKYIIYDAQRRWIGEDNDPALFVRPTVRHLTTGEFGCSKGRPHYHEIIYLNGATALPDVPTELYGQNFFHGQMSETIDLKALPHVESNRQYWPHGFSYIKPMSREDVRYTCKYVCKGIDEEGPYEVMRPSRSTRPMLGAGYLDFIARETVESGLPIRDEGYRLPPEPGYDGPCALFHLTRTGKLYLYDRYIRHLAGAQAPASPFLDRIRTVDEYRALRVWSEGERFFQLAAVNLAGNRAKEAAAASAAMETRQRLYGSVKSGDVRWGAW